MEKFKDTLHNLIVFIPIVIILIIICISQFIFEADHQQTYDRLKKQRTIQIDILAEQIDDVLEFSKTEEMDTNHIQMIKAAIEDMNVRDGVYVYLLDEDLNLISNKNSKYYKNKTSDDILAAFHEDADFINNIKQKEHSDYIKVSIEKEDDFEFYWKGIPLNTQETKYYLICGMSKDEISSNSAIITCKLFIGILNTLLMGIMYRNIYLANKIDELKRK